MAYSKECSFRAGDFWIGRPVIILAVLNTGASESKLKVSKNEHELCLNEEQIFFRAIVLLGIVLCVEP